MAGVTQPSADRSVRVAWAADAVAIGTVQVQAWRAGYADLLPAPALDGLDPHVLAQGWDEAIRRPPSARHRVLVALERNEVVGFAALGPAEDPDADHGADAELAALVVHPDHLGAGHGSRLLAAVVDTCRADGFARLTAWVLSADDALRTFLESAGWAADGAHREVGSDDDEATVRQVRLHASVVDP